MLEKDPKKQKHWDVHDERTFYKPQFFDKIETVDNKGNLKYWYEPKLITSPSSSPSKEHPTFKTYQYWQQRESGNWTAPRIYQDDCEPFY